MFSPERFLFIFIFGLGLVGETRERLWVCMCKRERGRSFVFFGYSSYIGWRMRTVTLEFDAMHFWHSSSVT